MALTPQEQRQLPVPQRTLPPGAAQQLGSVPPRPTPLQPTIAVNSAGQASVATVRPRTAAPTTATTLPTPQPTGTARTVPTGDGTQARMDQLKAERAARTGQARTAAAGNAAAQLASRPPVGPSSPLGAPPPGVAPAAAAPTPAAAALGTPPPGGPTSRILQAAKGTGRSLGKAAPYVGALLEGADVARVAQDPNATGIDVATQVAEGGGRLATAYLGAKGGAALGALGGPAAPVTVPAGAVIGGTLGYVGGDRAIDAGRSMGKTPNSIAAEAVMRAAGPGMPFGGGGVVGQKIASFLGAFTDAPDSSPASAAPDIGAAPAPAVATPSGGAPVAAGAAPAAAPGSAAEVLGDFNGRPITRGEADELAGKVNTVGAPPVAASAPAARQLGATVGSVSSSDSRKLAKQLDKTIADLGDLNMRGKRDLAGQLLGLKTRLVEGKAGTDTRLATEQAQINANSAAAQLGADTQLETAKIGAGSRSGGSPIVGEDGNLYTLQGNTLTPVTGADGKPAKAPANNKEAQGLYADLVKQLTLGGETPEQIAAIQQQAAALSGFGGQKPGATAAPEGYTQVGTSPDGKPVFQDAQGNKFTQ